MWDDEDIGDFMVDVGRRVERLRSVLDLNQTPFGDPVGLSQPHVSQIETGSRSLPIEIAIKLCTLHNVTLDWLYRGDPNGLPVRLNQKLIEAKIKAKSLKHQTQPPPKRLRLDRKIS